MRPLLFYASALGLLMSASPGLRDFRVRMQYPNRLSLKRWRSRLEMPDFVDFSSRNQGDDLRRHHQSCPQTASKHGRLDAAAIEEARMATRWSRGHRRAHRRPGSLAHWHHSDAHVGNLQRILAERLEAGEVDILGATWVKWNDVAIERTSHNGVTCEAAKSDN
ncbi:hypothetical protein JOL62DRAFT_560637 [Phyllosticta paracitricarpa]|uniref:Uncharacterized protein n=1 Tax=Phyllosticta paracitricarpa TaxID=2016321 RepID=A0ABR1MUV6_9PEZI